MITKKHFGTTTDGHAVTEYTLTNRQGIEMKVINYGCTITALKVPDRNGLPGDIVLGYDSLEGYLQSDAYLGCIVGRYANRIAYGLFSLDGKEYSLATNQPPHHLHGGVKGFSKVVWNAATFNNAEGIGIIFSHLSPDGDEGYPGNLRVDVKYFLSNDHSLSFEYHAVTDKPTIINLTQHSYFNLNGGKQNILGHELTIDADEFLPVDEVMVPTGEIRPVAGTPFDFRKAKTVGRDIDQVNDQLIIGHGYDHCFVIRKSSESLCHAATLYDDASGRGMDVYTTEPALQLYTANFLQSTMPGKNNSSLKQHSGLCLETQHFPDSPNHPGFPSVIIHPEEKYYSKTLISFSHK